MQMIHCTVCWDQEGHSHDIVREVLEAELAVVAQGPGVLAATCVVKSLLTFREDENHSGGCETPPSPCPSPSPSTPPPSLSSAKSSPEPPIPASVDGAPCQRSSTTTCLPDLTSASALPPISVLSVPCSRSLTAHSLSLKCRSTPSFTSSPSSAKPSPSSSLLPPPPASPRMSSGTSCSPSARLCESWAHPFATTTRERYKAGAYSNLHYRGATRIGSIHLSHSSG